MDGCDLQVIAALSEAARQEPQVVRRGAAALKDGRNFGVLPLKSITPGAADRLFDRLKERPAGGERVRTAVLVVTICKRGMSRGEVIE